VLNSLGISRSANGTPCIPHNGAFLDDIRATTQANPQAWSARLWNGSCILSCISCIAAAKVECLQSTFVTWYRHFKRFGTEVNEEDWRIADTQRLLPADHAQLGRWPIIVSQRLAGVSTPRPRPPNEVVWKPRVDVDGLSSSDRHRTDPSSPA